MDVRTVACSRVKNWKVSDTCLVYRWILSLSNNKTRSQNYDIYIEYIYEGGCDDESWPASGIQNCVSGGMWSLVQNQRMMSKQSLVVWVDRWTVENFQIFLKRGELPNFFKKEIEVINFGLWHQTEVDESVWGGCWSSKRVGRDSVRGSGVFGKMWLGTKLISKI